MDTYEMEQADKTMYQRYVSGTMREQVWASETTHLDPADLVESKIDPSQFKLADWPNDFMDAEYPCVPCAMCGHLLRWCVGFRHVDGDLIYVGEDCAVYLDSENVVEKKMKQFKTAQKNKEEKARAEAEWTRRRLEFVAEYLDVADYLNETEIAEEDYREAEKPTNLRAPMPFMLDMVHAYNKYGSLTENQLKAVQKIMIKQAEWEAKKAAEPQPTTPLVAGRYEMTGEILHVKWYDNDFGGSEKMTVRLSDNNKVFGTVPKSICDEVDHYDDLNGKQIRFTATVKPKADDEHFGYFSKPTKGSIV
jgi:hypothetical protein